jgi:hypothetical protein
LSCRSSRPSGFATSPKACCWKRKKRLRALAEWRFGGGDRYCRSCRVSCSECPAVLNRPLTIEGWQVWDLAQRLSGQLRAMPGAILGLDMTATLAMAEALSIDPLVCAELLPEVEGMLVRGLNARIRAEHDG